MRARRLTARWLLPVEGAPVECGALLVGSEGRIVAAGPDAAVPRPPDVPSEVWPDAALLPGFINTHTHLELTGFAGSLAEPEFPRWIRAIRELKAGRPAEAYLAAAREGLAAAFAAGVTTVADTGDSGAAAVALAEMGGSGIAYQEVFGPHPAQRDESMAGLRRRLEELGPHAGGRVRLGVSPHAPYTVSGPLYATAAQWARAQGLPLAVHLAESAAESELLGAAAGPFAAAWGAREIPLPSLPGCSPVAWLDRHGVLGPDTLCIHVVRVDDADVALLARRDAAVAHCPRSNAAHGHGAAPLSRLRAAGLRVGVGTDSEVSVAPPDLLADTRAARRLAGLDAAAALRLCTLDGARALGLAAETGSLIPGKWADCAVVALGALVPAADPVERLLATGPADVLATYVGGRPVFRSPRNGPR